jgi:hypothetical protein
MWEKTIAIGTVVISLQGFVLIWLAFNRPTSNLLVVGVYLVAVIALCVTTVFSFKIIRHRQVTPELQKQLVALPLRERQTWFFSPGTCISLNRSTRTLMVHLQILSTERTELTYVRIEVRDSKGMSIPCENSDPMIIGKLELTDKLLEHKISPQEIEALVVGSMLSLNGYAKFRDGEKIGQTTIMMTTIPSL